MRLWVRLALVMALLAVVPVLVVGGLAVSISTVRAEESSKTQLRTEAQLQADLLGRWVIDQATRLLTWPQLYANRLAEFPPALQQGFASMVYTGTPTALTVVLVDGNGRQIVEPVYSDGSVRAASSATRVVELLRRLPLRQALASPSTAHMGAPWTPDGVDGSVPSLPFAVLASGGPRPEDQRVLGVEIRLEIAEDLLGQVSASRAVALVGNDGDIVLGGDHPLLGGSVLDSLAEIQTSQAMDFDTAQLRSQVEVVPGTGPAPGTGWRLVVAESATNVLQPAREIRTNMLVSVLAAAAGGLGLALLVASSVSRPVERLRNAAMRVAEGAYDERIEDPRTDEIGDLSRAFDHMSERIAGFNQELQAQVAARTAELRDAQAELVRSGQLAAVAELGAGLAHDLNNPLTAVVGIAQVLRERNQDEPLLDHLEEQAQRCRDVVGTMLRVAELEVDPQETPVVEMQGILRQVAEIVVGAFRKRGIRLQVSSAEAEPVLVRAHPSHCARLVTQVLAGMRAGLDSGAEVVLGARRRGDTVVVQLDASHPVAERPERRDDWMASGHRLWVARQLVASIGGALVEHEDRMCFELVLPGG